MPVDMNDPDPRVVLVSALRSAVTAGSGTAARPGQLRQHVEAALGADNAQRFRREVHQLVAAAEEHLPADLRRLSPLTEETLRRLGEELAAARGWSIETAHRATLLWAAALGFEDLAARSWPPDVRPVAPRATPAPAPPPAPAAPAQPAAPAAPRLEEAHTIRITKEDNDAPTNRIRREPVAPAPVAPTPAPPPAVPPQYVPPQHVPPQHLPPQHVLPQHVPPAVYPDWPKPPKALRGLTQSTSGEPVLVAAVAYSGIPFAAFVGGVVAILTILSAALLLLPVTPLIQGVAAAVAAALAGLLVRLVGRGSLAVTPSGAEFMPWDRAMRVPQPQGAFRAQWHEVQVRPGRVSQIQLGDKRVQLGPKNAKLAAAIQAYHPYLRQR